jgi:DNA polymerase III alpha subunit
MIKDKFGQHIFTENDICEALLKDPEVNLENALVFGNIQFDPNLELKNTPQLNRYIYNEQGVEEFDNINSNLWFMPASYKNMDIASWILDQCKDQAQLQRAGEELILYQERGMFDLLRYLKYLVDTMREYKIVWGVGRGSSVASFVLYLIGIHRINSLYYDLDIKEFLK